MFGRATRTTRPALRERGRQLRPDRPPDTGAGVPARPGGEAVVVAVGDVLQGRCPDQRVQLRVDETDRRATLLIDQCGQPRPERGDRAGAADDELLAVHPDHVAALRAGVTRDVRYAAHGPRNHRILPGRLWKDRTDPAAGGAAGGVVPDHFLAQFVARHGDPGPAAPDHVRTRCRKVDMVAGLPVRTRGEVVGAVVTRRAIDGHPHGRRLLEGLVHRLHGRLGPGDLRRAPTDGDDGRAVG